MIEFLPFNCLYCITQVLNPATGEKIGDVPDLSVKETEYGIESCHNAFTNWSKSTGLERSHLLRQMNDLLLKHEDEISHIITLENVTQIFHVTIIILPFV